MEGNEPKGSKPSYLHLASFRRRVIARLLDVLFLGGILYAIGYISESIFDTRFGANIHIYFDAVRVQSGILGIGTIAFLYFVPFTAKYGQTLGKKIAGIKVIKRNNTVPGWAFAILRQTLAALLSGQLGLALITSMISGVMAPLIFILYPIGGTPIIPNFFGQNDMLDLFLLQFLNVINYYLIMPITLFWPLWDRYNQTLYDKLTDTYVVRAIQGQGNEAR